MTWTKNDQAQLDDLNRKKAEHENWLRRGVEDLVDRIRPDQYDLVDKLIENRLAFIEVLERFEDEQ